MRAPLVETPASYLQTDQGGRARSLTVSEGGVDLTLVRWMRSMNPAERLRTLQGVVDSLMRLRRGRFGT